MMVKIFLLIRGLPFSVFNELYVKMKILSSAVFVVYPYFNPSVSGSSLFGIVAGNGLIFSLPEYFRFCGSDRCF